SWWRRRWRPGPPWSPTTPTSWPSPATRGWRWPDRPTCSHADRTPDAAPGPRGSSMSDDTTLLLNLRSRARAAGQDTFPTVERQARGDAARTALVVCDLWDGHWCRSAARRVDELAGPLNDAVAAARRRGVFIIHAPSTVTAFYAGTPQRRLAQDAP